MAKGDAYIDFLKIAGLLADVAFVLLLIEVVFVSADNDPPWLFIDG